MCRLTTIMIMIRTITGTNYKTQPLLAQYFLLLLLNESEIQRKAIAHDPANTKHTVLCVEAKKQKLYKIRYERLRQSTKKTRHTTVRENATEMNQTNERMKPYAS